MPRTGPIIGLLVLLGCSPDVHRGITTPDPSRRVQPLLTAASDVVVVVYDVFVSSPALAAPVPAGTATFGPPIVSFLLDRADAALDGTVVQAVDAADAAGPSPVDGCTPLSNAASVAGNIALIQRGTCAFVIKARNAQDAGAIAAVVYDNVDGPVAGMAGADPSLTIPSIRITRAAGTALSTASPTTARLFLVAREVPTLSVPDDIVVEATSPAGATVTYSVSASNSTGDVPFSCTHTSGSVFPLGTTIVECTAGAAGDSQVTKGFSVTVVDTTPPTLTLPANIVADATGPTGASVPYVTSATDLVGVFGGVVCTPSDQQFPIGLTTVSCSASDAAGNTATGTFTVTVQGAADQIGDLREAVDDLPDTGEGAGLEAKLKAALSALASGNQSAACGGLAAFINQLRAQAGKKIPLDDAQRLIADAERVRIVIGCR